LAVRDWQGVTIIMRRLALDRKPQWGYILRMDITDGKLQVVVELPEFIKQAARCLSDSQRTEFIDYIAKHPEKGDIIQGTGGARKIRWASDNNKGKSSGVRVVYFFFNRENPILLFTLYPKNERDNLSQSEKNVLHGIIKQIVKQFREQ